MPGCMGAHTLPFRVPLSGNRDPPSREGRNGLGALQIPLAQFRVFGHN